MFCRMIHILRINVSKEWNISSQVKIADLTLTDFTDFISINCSQQHYGVELAW